MTVGHAHSPHNGVVLVEAVTQRYKNVYALNDAHIQIPQGCLVGLIGPDGVGKSTLLSIIAGVRQLQQGDVFVLGGSVHDNAHRKACQHRIAYMPQGLGKNLYPTLSVEENLDFFGRLFGQNVQQRYAMMMELTHATGLYSFLDRPAGKLSGGMKQKLGLCCALMHAPELLLLDEPTTGVDPLSRRQFWELLAEMRRRNPQMSVLVATAYMEEARQCEWLAAMYDGKVVATGTPEYLLEKTHCQDLESAFLAMLPFEATKGHKPVILPPYQAHHNDIAIEAKGLTCCFGDFTAVDHVDFRIRRGEIFGFLGSNGCGKTTTMKMLTGLLASSEGEVQLFGKPLATQSEDARMRVGYMSQSFSLYTELSVRQNLELHARLYQLAPALVVRRVQEMLEEFDLSEVAHQSPDALPLGIKQRLQLAVALIHAPELLILDEPTSGVDPVARDHFWQYLIDLSRNKGVTIFISTHFMNEAMRCDRISLMHAGKVLAAGSPIEIINSKGSTNLEEAFIAYLTQAQGEEIVDDHGDASGVRENQSKEMLTVMNQNRWFSRQRCFAYTLRETKEIFRDPLRLLFALLGPLVLMITFGYGISLDVENIRFAVWDQDRTVQSQRFLESFRGSRYFKEMPEMYAREEVAARLRRADIAMAIEIPAGFGRELLGGHHPEVGIWLDGAMPFRAETIRGYVQGMMVQQDVIAPASRFYTLEPRFRYNPSFKSVNAMIPSVLTIILVMIPAIMTAVAVTREKETGSITNFRATPTTQLEFLLGKQIPYLAIFMTSFVLLMMTALWLFGLQVKGSWVALVVGVLLYLGATTGFGLLVSCFTKTQIAALFAASIISMIPAVNFSGLLVPVSALTGSARVMGLTFPSAWFQQISLGTFSKGLGMALLWHYHVMLALFFVVFVILAACLLRKQER